MESEDIRWKQRLDNYCRAVARLKEAAETLQSIDIAENVIEEMLRDSLIQRFEFTHELSWKLMKDYAEYQGYQQVRGSRDAVRAALQMGLIADRYWMDMIDARNTTSHRYDEEAAIEVSSAIVDVYLPLFEQFRITMQSIE